MSSTPRPISITQSKGIWREHEIDVVLEVSPGMTTVLNVSRNHRRLPKRNRPRRSQ